MLSTELNSTAPHLHRQYRADRINQLIRFLKTHRADVMELLTDVASYNAAKAEFEAALQALEGGVAEVAAQQPKSQHRMAVFMPSNVMLYSYVLYLVIPSLYVEEIDFRPSSHVARAAERLHALLASVHRLPLHLRSESQRDFIEQRVKPATVVIFTGTYSNSEKLKTQLRPDQLYIFFGQGVNPFVIGEAARLDRAVDDLIDVRMFNTGQDCMGPDAIFVHATLRDAFVERLESRIQRFVFGSRKDPDADYTPIYYESTLELLSRYFIGNARFIAEGGIIDYPLHKIFPTILYSALEEQPAKLEFFGPVFNVIFYDSDADLIKELSRDFYIDRAMGASVYGSAALEQFLSKRHVVSVDSTLFDIENGNQAFGGYGAMANHVRYQGRITIEPILISQVIARLLPEAAS